ncbi:MAG: hypothetical protein QOE62_434 [Actinomycetota bacterium]|jgi:hypothetical protein|nr:hypothetical protein [Actinomycetota bacterium]
MHVLRVVRVLLAVLIVAAIVGAGSSVLSARPDLQKAKHNVDSSWSGLSPRLDHRYDLLLTVDVALRPIAGPVHALVGDVDGALAQWRDTRAHSGVAAQVGAANNVEAVARRLVATASASPRVRQNAAALTALSPFLADKARKDAGAGFNQNVASYEQERRGPVRTLIASVLGDGSIPILDTTETPSSAS